jgi:hypothetical protein
MLRKEKPRYHVMQQLLKTGSGKLTSVREDGMEGKYRGKAVVLS